MFKENNFYQFDVSTSCDKQGFLEMKRKKNNVTVPFNDQQIKLINNTLLYYQFMGNNNNEVMVENPD